MLKGDLISVTMSRLSGEQTAGKEIAVNRATVRRVIDALIRFYFVVDYRQQREELRQEGVQAVRTLSPVGEAFVSDVFLEIVKNNSVAHVDFPHLPLLTPGMHWLREVLLSSGADDPSFHTASVEVIPSLRPLRGMPMHVLQGTTYVYPQRTGDGMRLAFYLLDPAVSGCRVRYVRDPSGYADDEFMPLPAGIEPPILEWALNYFLGNRQLPADNIPNDRDDAKP